MSIRALLMTTGALALTAASAQAFTLNVLHFNDFHSWSTTSWQTRDIRPASTGGSA